jgi:polyvinyl alcohol dehydrogenase (cytochrome)
MRLVVFAASFSLLMSSSAFAQQPPNGEAVYKQHCAACHDGAMPRMPSRETLRGYLPEAIETALASFSMRREGAALSGAERRAVSEFLAGRPAGSYRSPLDAMARSAFCGPGAGGRTPLAGAAWNGWGAGQHAVQPAAAPRGAACRG